MIAKYDGRCHRCSGLISRGERIGWSEKTGAMHPACFEAEIAEHGAEKGAIDPSHFTDDDPVFRIARSRKAPEPGSGELL